MRRVTGGWTVRVLVVGVVVAFVAAALPAPAGADHGWDNYHWGRTANPFTLTVVDSMVDTPAGEWDRWLGEAMADWSGGSAVLALAYEGGDTSSGTRKRCPAVSGKVRACNAEYGRTGWLGLASIWASGSHIMQATAKMNDTYYNTATYNTPAWRDFVVCQEIGHDFGLGHQDEGFGPPNLGTCMDYTSDPDGGGDYGPANLQPDQHDYEMVDQIHSHTDSSSTVKSSTTAGQSGVEIPDPSGPEQGGVSVFVTDLGRGSRVIQFVIWADANLMAATHANPNAPVAGTTTDQDGIPVDGGTHDHEDGTHDHAAAGPADADADNLVTRPRPPAGPTRTTRIPTGMAWPTATS